ncbi:hypothetical protein EV09_1429 [Prochlorococcus marinus str. SS35]|nr:hypothetical protein EV09_1429 [Prochlorococcus marinus str. SS35]
MILVFGSSVNSWLKGIDGLFGAPMKRVKMRDTSATTATSTSPVIAAIGKSKRSDLFLFFGSVFKRRTSNLNV